ncbi:MAG: DUF554 domain-containing protein [Candidatus Heimdallarchaeota archaeon]|nr:DUF554 domain-containing protein [Candidatus Heimdallarchaeota archaeon]
MLGTIINVIAVIIGSFLGITLGKLYTEEMKEITTKAIGLITIIIGIQMSLASPLTELQFLIMMFSLVIGAIIGVLLQIEDNIDRFGNWLKSRAKSTDSTFVEGFVVASIIYETGPMAILGAIKDGVNQQIDLLIIKSGLDGIMSIALTASMGIGVIFSIIPMVLYQGSITILASLIGSELSSTVQSMIYAVGGVLILGLGIRILEIKEIPVGNMIPSVLLVIPFTLILEFILSFV